MVFSMVLVRSYELYILYNIPLHICVQWVVCDKIGKSFIEATFKVRLYLSDWS